MNMSKMDLQDALQVPSPVRTYHVNSTLAALTLTLEEWQTDVKVHTVASDGNIIINLPPVSLCKGKEFVIELLTLGDNETVTIKGNTTSVSEGWSDIVLTAANDRATVWSNGVTWCVLEDVST